MSLLDELKSKFNIREGDSVSTSLTNIQKEAVIVTKTVSAVGSGGSPTSAFGAKCKVCRQIMMLTPDIPEARCGCGTIWSLPQG
jgi:hypothetical protein